MGTEPWQPGIRHEGGVAVVVGVGVGERIATPDPRLQPRQRQRAEWNERIAQSPAAQQTLRHHEDETDDGGRRIGDAYDQRHPATPARPREEQNDPDGHAERGEDLTIEPLDMRREHRRHEQQQEERAQQPPVHAVPEQQIECEQPDAQENGIEARDPPRRIAEDALRSHNGVAKSGPIREYLLSISAPLRSSVSSI